MMIIEPGNVSLSQLRRVWNSPVQIELHESCWEAVDASAQAISDALESGATIYGVNTGFGLLANTRIGAERLKELQVNLVRSHCAGVGAPMPPAIVRLMMVLKVASLARGFSGVRRAVIETLTRWINSDVLPVIPEQGSVGASGDLAPLAHMASALCGEGLVFTEQGVREAREVIAELGWEPLELGPKEGLALLNGTQASTAFTLAGLFELEDVFAAGIAAGAMTTDAVMGSDAPFDPRIHLVRGHRGQGAVAEVYRALLEGSEIRASHVDCERVQDPYSIRCQPQVMGAILDQMYHAAYVLEVEANAVSDNPLVFPETGEVLSGGNFHAEPVAFVADALAVAFAELGSLSERRIALLIDPNLSELPAFLVAESGVNSGFMIAQVTAASVASENKSLAHPASVDSLPTSANQEDHVSMATFAGRRLGPMASNVRTIIGIELLCAAQGIDFRAPLETSEALAELHGEVRAHVPHYDRDRRLSEDIEFARDFIASGAGRHFVPAGLLPTTVLSPD